MKQIFVITMLVAATVASYSQTNNARTVVMSVTPREQKAIENDRIRQMQYEAMRQIQKVTDTNKIAAITAQVVAAQPKTNAPASPISP